ncbi:hypothetical protein UFOVP1615_2 [uncultured Caudovirales phage]|uniref:Uncharacterized protein n=1 Tax=uncultured Caudovirales phage TaxID=2100421 RepID=A0A6J5SXR1_9CAUD|nr:hypothetical protein UFOVP1615_2 [uncultured Caudovirales phage]
MRRVVLTILDYMLVTIYFATIIIGLSILGAFIAFQVVDYRDGKVQHQLSSKK